MAHQWVAHVDNLLGAGDRRTFPRTEQRRFRSDAELRAQREEDERRWDAHRRATATRPGQATPKPPQNGGES